MIDAAKGRDRVALGLVSLFVLGNFLADAAWLVSGTQAAGLCPSLAALGWDCGPQTPVDGAREALNGTLTQLLEIWLLVALLRRRPERHALQLAVGASVVYAVAIDVWLGLVAAVTGLAPSVAAGGPAMVVAAIRGAGHLYLAGAAVAAIMPLFRDEERAAAPAAIHDVGSRA